jgi:hypothetical protein
MEASRFRFAVRHDAMVSNGARPCGSGTHAEIGSTEFIDLQFWGVNHSAALFTQDHIDQGWCGGPE